MGLSKDSGGRNGVPALSALASRRATVGEAGRGRAGAGFLDVACQQTNKNHKLEESLAQFTKKKKKDNLVAHQAVRHWICLKWWTLYAKIGGHNTSQRMCWKALGRRALPRLSRSAGSQDPTAITGGVPSRHPALRPHGLDWGPPLAAGCGAASTSPADSCAAAAQNMPALPRHVSTRDLR